MIHPHVRGDYEDPRPLFAAPSRSIPTCVGTTKLPEVREAVEGGPSPRAWGLRLGAGGGSPPLAVHPHVRGDYGSASLGASAGPVHPHVRGDYVQIAFP